MKRISAVRLLDEIEAALDRYGRPDTITVEELVHNVREEIVSQARTSANRKKAEPPDMIALELDE